MLGARSVNRRIANETLKSYNVGLKQQQQQQEQQSNYLEPVFASLSSSAVDSSSVVVLLSRVGGGSVSFPSSWVGGIATTTNLCNRSFLYLLGWRGVHSRLRYQQSMSYPYRSLFQSQRSLFQRDARSVFYILGFVTYSSLFCSWSSCCN